MDLHPFLCTFLSVYLPVLRFFSSTTVSHGRGHFHDGVVYRPPHLRAFHMRSFRRHFADVPTDYFTLLTRSDPGHGLENLLPLANQNCLTSKTSHCHILTGLLRFSFSNSVPSLLSVFRLRLRLHCVEMILLPAAAERGGEAQKLPRRDHIFNESSFLFKLCFQPVTGLFVGRSSRITGRLCVSKTRPSSRYKRRRLNDQSSPLSPMGRIILTVNWHPFKECLLSIRRPQGELNTYSSDCVNGFRTFTRWWRGSRRNQRNPHTKKALTSRHTRISSWFYFRIESTQSKSSPVIHVNNIKRGKQIQYERTITRTTADG